MSRVLKHIAYICFTLITVNAHAVTLSVPENIIALSSTQGSKLFNRSYSPDYFWPLSFNFTIQKNRKFCSVASAVTVLNALQVAAPKDPHYLPYHLFSQDNFFTKPVSNFMTVDAVNQHGATLEALGRAMATFAVKVQLIPANKISLSKFRKMAAEIVNKKKGYIIINFYRQVLGEEGYGHFSPLAAYDERSDRFLMLDVAKYRYPPTWVMTEDLWHAMRTKDKSSNKFRGLLVVSAIQ